MNTIHKKVLITIITLLSVVSLFAQTHKEQLERKNQMYLEELESLKTSDNKTPKVSGFTPFKRSYYYQSARLDSSQNMNGYMNAINDYYDINREKSTESSQESWEYVGPVGIPGDGIYPSATNSTGKGWTYQVMVNPNNPAEIYAGTHNSGLWKTDNGGDSWYSLTDPILREEIKRQ